MLFTGNTKSLKYMKTKTVQNESEHKHVNPSI